MKRILCLFPLYILLLSGIPCQADDGCCIEETNIASTRHNDTFPDKKTELPCSPFFACGACHGFIIPIAGVQVIHVEAPDAPRLIHYHSDPLPDFSAAVWQPPRTV